MNHFPEAILNCQFFLTFVYFIFYLFILFYFILFYFILFYFITIAFFLCSFLITHSTNLRSCFFFFFNTSKYRKYHYSKTELPYTIVFRGREQQQTGKGKKIIRKLCKNFTIFCSFVSLSFSFKEKITEDIFLRNIPFKEERRNRFLL
jgi:hypothetical protein